MSYGFIKIKDKAESLDSAYAASIVEEAKKRGMDPNELHQQLINRSLKRTTPRVIATLTVLLLALVGLWWI